MPAMLSRAMPLFMWVLEVWKPSTETDMAVAAHSAQGIFGLLLVGG